jgi:hypothetical protein
MKISRKETYPGGLVLIDGMTGTGKTIFTKLFDLSDDMNFTKFNYNLEQICVLAGLNMMNKDAAISQIKLITDLDRFNFSISREINLRFLDLSSIWKSRKRIKYIYQLFSSKEPEQVLLKHPKDLVYIVHQLLDYSNLLEEAYPNKIRNILCMRHPIYLFNHWNSYVDNHGVNPRDLTILKDFKNKDMPWFISRFEKEFSKSDSHNKAAIAITELTLRSLDFIKRKKGESNFIIIDFEKFVLNPDKYVLQIKEVFDIKAHKIKKCLEKENVPRIHINSSAQKKIYKRYFSDNLKTELSHKEDYVFLKNQIKSQVNEKIWAEFEKSIQEYEKEFGLWF